MGSDGTALKEDRKCVQYNMRKAGRQWPAEARVRAEK